MIIKELKNRIGEASSYANLGAVYKAVGEYESIRISAKEYRLENISRNHLRSGEKLETEMEKLTVTRTLELCIDQLANMRRLENISRNHL